MNSPSSAKQPSNDKGGGGRDGAGGGGEGGTSNEDVDILRKEYRNMQANRNAFAHESELVLRRQQATLDKLREENKTLKDDVARIQTRHMTRPINNFEQSQLDRLYQELDKYSSLVESEKAKAAATENEITKLREDIWTRRQEMGGVNAAANNQRVVEKQVRLLESQLDQALVKFNKCVSRNKRLREEIDGLRGERVTFEKVYRKVEMDLRDKKKHMALVIEQSNKAYEERDKAQLEIVAIERLNRKEEDSYHQQIMDLAEELEKVNEQLLSSTKRGQTATVIDPEDEERTAAERREFARATEVACAEEEYAQQCDEKLRSYEDAFHEISTATGISDVDELVQAFIENEEQNFSLFRYSNEQASEIERLEDDIQSLREEEMRYKASASDTRRDDVLKLQNDIHSIDELTKAYESKCERYQNIMDEVKDEIKLLLIRLNCKFDEELTSDNILHYLGIVEERALEIVSKYLRTKNDSNPTTSSSYGGSTMGVGAAARTASTISVNAPRLLDYSSDDSGEEGGESLKPVHRTDMNYSKIASTIPRRKTVGRRGSIFGVRPVRASLVLNPEE